MLSVNSKLLVRERYRGAWRIPDPARWRKFDHQSNTAFEYVPAVGRLRCRFLSLARSLPVSCRKRTV